MKVLITGVTGTLGKRLTGMFLEAESEVIGVSRCEFKQSQVGKKDGLTLYLCDVRDRDRLLEASRGVDLVIHTAAMKRIEMCDDQPEESIATNIYGTENVLHCQRHNDISKVVLISTDKAALPITTYGATKFIAESLVLRNPHNACVRYGNVLCSRGSVVETFMKSIQEEGVIRVTDKRCTRFWWSVQDAADFVWNTTMKSVGGLFIPTLKAYPVVKLGFAIAHLLGRPEPKVVEVGFRSREKLHEVLRTEDEGGLMESSDQSLWFNSKEIKEVLTHAIEDIL